MQLQVKLCTPGYQIQVTNTLTKFDTQDDKQLNLKVELSEKILYIIFVSRALDVFLDLFIKIYVSLHLH